MAKRIDVYISEEDNDEGNNGGNNGGPDLVGSLLIIFGLVVSYSVLKGIYDFFATTYRALTNY